MVILAFVVLSIGYGIFLLKNNFRFVSLFFLAMYSVSFLLPVIINIRFDYKFYLSDVYFDRLNLMYLIGLIIFIISNAMFNLTRTEKVNNSLLKPHILSKSSINKLFSIFVCLFLLMVLIIGLEVIVNGTAATLELPSILKIFQSITIVGLVYSALLKIYFSNNKKEVFLNIIIAIICILCVSLFIFGRRLILYPLIAIVALFIFKRNKTPSLFKLSMLAIVVITIVLPGMMSIRTLGFQEGVKNFAKILSGDYDQYLQYLSIGTDVTYSYSLAGIILASDIRITPITLLKPILSFIPRSIFPNKPQPISEAIVSHLNLDFNKGMSIPPGIVGESYLYGGFIGVIIIFILLGLLSGCLDNYLKYLRDQKNGVFSLNLIFIMIVSTQFISGTIRGDTATNIQESIYLFIPFLFFLIITRYKFVFSSRQQMK
ncbi:oligosaccharide repeat unit polymerase [Staphylococcus hyicus]|uniref:oligosaccharide repeat unit polymerase n=2 Tax=Staphylococcus hyicus TaxID=1284 RepID=UPI0018EBD907|nr:oligosaccharide repeat unit polymerase [Staphylococcus hyicus]